MSKVEYNTRANVELNAVIYSENVRQIRSSFDKKDDYKSKSFKAKHLQVVMYVMLRRVSYYVYWNKFIAGMKYFS